MGFSFERGVGVFSRILIIKMHINTNYTRTLNTSSLNTWCMAKPSEFYLYYVVPPQTSSSSLVGLPPPMVPPPEPLPPGLVA